MCKNHTLLLFTEFIFAKIHNPHGTITSAQLVNKAIWEAACTESISNSTCVGKDADFQSALYCYNVYTFSVPPV